MLIIEGNFGASSGTFFFPAGVYIELLHKKHCIVSLPVGWLFSCRTELPELEQEDLQSFLDTQAEREFPLPLDGLQIAQAPFQDHLEASHLFRMALPTQRFGLLNEVMERAGLKPLSWSVAQAGPSFLQSLGVQDALCLLSTPMGYDLLAVSGGALVMGRSLSESNQPQQLAREIKISLGELSLEMQRSIRTCLIPLQASQEGVAQEALVQLQERMGMSHRLLLLMRNPRNREEMQPIVTVAIRPHRGLPPPLAHGCAIRSPDRVPRTCRRQRQPAPSRRPNWASAPVAAAALATLKRRRR